MRNKDDSFPVLTSPSEKKFACGLAAINFNRGSLNIVIC